MKQNNLLFSYGFPESVGRITVPEGKTAEEFNITFDGNPEYARFCELSREVSTYQTPEKRIGVRTRIEEIEGLHGKLEEMWTINARTFSPARFQLTNLSNYAIYLLDSRDAEFKKHPTHRQILTKWSVRSADE